MREGIAKPVMHPFYLSETELRLTAALPVSQILEARTSAQTG
jgi:hypothetical protein